MPTKQRSKRGKNKRKRILPKHRPRGMTDAEALALRNRDIREAEVKFQSDMLIRNFTPRQIDAIANPHDWSEWWRRGLFYPQQIPKMID